MWTTLGNEAHRAGDRIGDDAGALALAERLVTDAGFDPVVVGTLSEAKRFDPGRSSTAT
ncbi:hypothetical protein [Mesorhizobium sp. B4-1-1]|uniref:hypothetical protein n=1 Tax=Mesorhizobium sp. B4-1-1 TaxID=2589890 RepID=UPI001AED2634|nr:hypothetical protein [Mesorhizobium sp. B4-1-1]